MKCPLMLMRWQEKADRIEFEPMDCLKENCAWWVQNAKRCSIRCITESLGQVALTAIALRKSEDN